jgi:hypothetical protein
MAGYAGGSFAPPLTDELLAKYQASISGMDQGPVRDACATLLAACVAWWNQPESSGSGTPHPSGRGSVVPLDYITKAALWELIPWTHEIDGIRSLLDTLPAGPTRDMAFHLLWHVVELDLDREPITADKL